MRWCLRICDDSPTGAAGCGTDLMVDSRGAGTDENRGARTHLASSSFRAFRFATRYPGGRRGLCFRADVHIRPLHQFLRGTASGSEKRSRDNAITTPTTSAPSATGRQSQKSQKMIACPKAGQNRRLHRSADPRRAEARTRRSASKRSFLLDRARPVFFSARPNMGPPPRPARWGEEEQGSRRSFRRRRKRS